MNLPKKSNLKKKVGIFGFVVDLLNEKCVFGFRFMQKRMAKTTSKVRRKIKPLLV